MEKLFICKPDEPVVSTKYGKLRGYFFDKSYIFHGIRYAQAKRFHAPEAPDCWEGIQDALTYGKAAPYNVRGAATEVSLPLRYWPMDENCQYLNVWTPSLDADAKKPVMVWFHGGGYGAGSGIEQMHFNGQNLSQAGDVVVVTVNHRLNILGYLDLSAFGDEYANSGNAGDADLVAALEWVRDNIAAFGGDPGNVTIFGQSGGGAKTRDMMRCHAADGLYHRAIVQSGVFAAGGLAPESSSGEKLIRAMLEDLGLDSAKELETIPYSQLSNSYDRVSPIMRAAGEYVGGSPQYNDWLGTEPTEYALGVPVMAGTVFAEFSSRRAVHGKRDLSDDEIRARLEAVLGEHTDRLLEMFRAVYPEKHPADLLALDSSCRPATMEYLRELAGKSRVGVWAYLFNYECPYMGGYPAEHNAEIPFLFRNTAMVPMYNEPGVTEKLEAEVSDAWLRFARTGNPGWEPCTTEREVTMVFDRTSAVRTDFDRELLALLGQVSPVSLGRPAPAAK